MSEQKPKVDLGCISGPEGNAYVVMGRCQEAAKRAGWSQAQIDSAMAQMKGGDYEHLLRVACELFQVRFRR